jgi:hypothetical protein
MSLRRRAWFAAWAAAVAALSTGCAAPVAAPLREWRGVLSRKGSPPGLYWALLDDAGREWRLTPVAGWEPRLLAWQGRRVRLTGRLGADPQGDEVAPTALDTD